MPPRTSRACRLVTPNAIDANNRNRWHELGRPRIDRTNISHDSWISCGLGRVMSNMESLEPSIATGSGDSSRSSLECVSVSPEPREPHTPSASQLSPRSALTPPPLRPCDGGGGQWPCTFCQRSMATWSVDSGGPMRSTGINTAGFFAFLTKESRTMAKLAASDPEEIGREEKGPTASQHFTYDLCVHTRPRPPPRCQVG